MAWVSTAGSRFGIKQSNNGDIALEVSEQALEEILVQIGQMEAKHAARQKDARAQVDKMQMQYAARKPSSSSPPVSVFSFPLPLLPAWSSSSSSSSSQTLAGASAVVSPARSMSSSYSSSSLSSSSPMHNETVYALQLTDDKWYIGRTSVGHDRVIAHFNGIGSAWTKAFKPISIDKEWQTADRFDEDKYTLQYMKKYGLDNVRGGSWCQVQLSSDDQTSIRKQLANAANVCQRCHLPGHFIAECRMAAVSYSSAPSSAPSTETFGLSQRDAKHDSAFVGRDPRHCAPAQTHYPPSSLSAYQPLPRTKYSDRRQTPVYKPAPRRPYHDRRQTISPIVSGACYKCGRKGHLVSNCFARTTVDGQYLAASSSTQQEHWGESSSWSDDGGSDDDADESDG